MVRQTIIATAAVAALAAAAHASPPDPPADGLVASRAAWVKVSSCSRADHSAVFYARMRRLEHGQRLLMRFTLLERGPDGRFSRVEAPALNRWRKSKPGVRAFGYRQRVRGLAADSAYRARVEYRWYGADGRLDRRVRRRSGVCSQAGPLPNLRARVVGTGPGLSPGSRRYTVRLANAGAIRALDVGVQLAVEGAGSQARTVARVPAGTAVLLDFEAPECLTGVIADADPGDAIRESNEVDNAQRLACPDLP